MGNKILIKQPNGKYAQYCTSIDEFDFVDKTVEEILEIEKKCLHARYLMDLEHLGGRLIEEIQEINREGYVPDDYRGVWQIAADQAFDTYIQCNREISPAFKYLRKQDWFKAWATEHAPAFLEEDIEKAEEIWLEPIGGKETEYTRWKKAYKEKHKNDSIPNPDSEDLFS